MNERGAAAATWLAMTLSAAIGSEGYIVGFVMFLTINYFSSANVDFIIAA
jgi:hypothetical protein